MGDTRTKNSSRNIIFSLMAYFLQVVLGFFVRRYFIYIFGTEYLGLNSLFTNVISILSLAELGFGSALVFAMYKPMADGDKEKVRQLLQFYRKSYMIIGSVIGVIGLCVLPFMNYFQAKAPSVNVDLYIVYLIYLFNTVVSYFFAYRRSLLYVNQRNDIESKVGILCQILSTILQLGVLAFVKDYYIYVCVSVFATILSNALIYLITQKKYADLVIKPLSSLDKTTRKQINKNILAMLFHKIGGTVVYSTDSLIIYLMFDALTLGKYSNYLLITGSVNTIINLFLSSLRGSIGNSIASESIEKNYFLFKKLNYIYLWIVSFCAIAIFALSNPFINIVLNKGGGDLTFDLTMISLISLCFFMQGIRYMTCVFKECKGLFYEDRFKPLFESIINLVVSIVLAHYIGLAGVIIGTMASSLLCIIVEPYVLNKHYFKKSTPKYLVKLLYYFVLTVLTGVATYIIIGLIKDVNIWTLVFKFAICAILPNVVLLLGLVWLPEFKDCINWGKQMLNNRKNKVSPSTTPLDVEICAEQIDEKDTD